MRRRIVRSLLAGLLAVFVAIQLVPVQRTNPPFDPAIALERSVALPSNVRAILDRSCKDCHSNETRWPGYGYVAPASWLLVRDVNEGREHLNFSEWGLQDAEAQPRFADRNLPPGATRPDAAEAVRVDPLGGTADPGRRENTV